MALKIIKILLTLAVLFAAFYRADWVALRESLHLMPAWAFAMSLILLCAVFIIPSYMQSLLFMKCGKPLPVKSIYRVNFISMFYSLVAPGDIAAAIVRVVRLRDRARNLHGGELTQTKVIGVLLWDKLINMFSLVFICVLALTFDLLGEGVPVSLKIALWALLVLSCLIFAAPKILPRLGIKVKRAYLQSLMDKIMAVTDIMGGLKLRFAVGLFLLSLIYQSLCLVCLDLIPSYAMGLNLPLGVLFGSAAVILLARSLPLTLSGIGIREMLYPLLITQSGVSHERLVAIGLVGTSIALGTSFIGALMEIHYRWQKRPLSEVETPTDLG